MAELEVHHEHENLDPTGRKVGVMAALLAVALAIVTIASHRAHTAAIIHKSNANDAWQYYQSARIKYHSLELGRDLAGAIGSNRENVDTFLRDYAAQMQKYDRRAKEIQEQAKKAEEATEADERQGLHFDIGEGLLEIALVLSSLYFISRKKMFPAIGILAGLAGVAVALTGIAG